ncbi:MAG: hypothetical protein B7733_12455 [Myxococcales bacterium FL481]|nr:MAG: hypothetical protein B7733_12455 [Myxococcales bacterium FL481]
MKIGASSLLALFHAGTRRTNLAKQRSSTMRSKKLRHGLDSDPRNAPHRSPLRSLLLTRSRAPLATIVNVHLAAFVLASCDTSAEVDNQEPELDETQVDASPSAAEAFLAAHGELTNASSATHDDFRRAQSALTELRQQPVDNAQAESEANAVDARHEGGDTIYPFLECIEPRSWKRYRAFWGYKNTSDAPRDVPIGDKNRFRPGRKDRGQPESFAPGRNHFAFKTSFRRDRAQWWQVDGHYAKASRRSPWCIELAEVTPELKCVDQLEDGKFRAHWSYTNHKADPARVRVGWWNAVWPPPIYQGQPQFFDAGHHEDAFQTTFDGAKGQTWWLLAQSATATADSPRCGPDLCEDVVCEDNNACTNDDCDPLTGACVYTPVDDGTSCTLDSGAAGQCSAGECVDAGECDSDDDCSDGLFCNGEETCNTDTRECVGGTEPCTEDGDVCNGTVTCDEDADECLDGTPLDCEDNNECTADACDSITGCSNDPVADGTSCESGTGTCQAGTCVTDLCLNVECDDNDACNGLEVCDENTGDCVDGTPLDCEDNNECTADACDATTGCSNEPVSNGTLCDQGGGSCQDGVCVPDLCLGNTCDDADVCNGAETCDPNTGDCVDGMPLDCDDDNECTADTCDAVTGCASAPVDDGISCESGTGTCQAGTCVTDLCLGVECDDNDVCNGLEVCDENTGDCTPGTPLDCEDNNECTADTCDATDGCANTPVDDGTSCQDGAGTCQGGACELDLCFDVECDDNDVCNGLETCDDTTGDCVDGTALDCDDANECTADACDATDGCSNVALEDGTDCTTASGAFGSCQAGDCSALNRYTAGHGDLAFEFEFDADLGEFEVFVEAEGATINGVDDVDGSFDLDELGIVTTATFTRPDPDFGFFEDTCIAPGESLHWLPQGNGDAAANGVPFLGIASEVEAGTFVDDVIDLQLVDVQSPDGSGHYSLWKDGFGPTFSMASCDGITADDDTLTLPLGHDHFNMGFADGGLGVWNVTYEVSAELAAGGEASAEVTVKYVIE